MVGVVVQVVDLIWRYWVMIEGFEGDLADGYRYQEQEEIFRCGSQIVVQEGKMRVEAEFVIGVVFGRVRGSEESGSESSGSWM